MSGDNLRRVTTGKMQGQNADERVTPLGETERPESHDPPSRDAITESLDPVIDDVVDGETAVDDGLVTQSLEEILLAMIAVADGGTHGTGLMEELEAQFGAELSPGTVYPRLHELEADGTLQMHELVQTKQYGIADDAAAKEQIATSASQHLALGLFLHASLDAL
ncbi:ParR family transcriptional regulator [Haloarcula hispanica N601]|uniref:ParR family transcriptional regulator n=3 Tax=Haloarcula hispanica TaxID=51589 RepID=V5TR00_HALHI|nr:MULTISPECIES: helix-turn-helix transcriptional regulator [Haloarcula]AHB67055.1 ParR family transcriptional regulator [Haloarcula hispanica N601]KAA9406027.1 PadR family transcriptional regulator [Haloarcula sp. CBA1131]KAA9410948.1 PadR family transcriptional regulator [Haloarcula hispanica]KZX47159.1 PadR family transcriptional regulator [Haloarcula sp. K1]MUV51233.1 PadR family transcriptional regulator [Haloarcula sp. CBA1122]